MDCGVPASEFWDLTLQEIADAIESHARRKKESINQCFVLADAISSRIGYFFSDPKKRNADDIYMPWDAYPSLFAKEEETVEEKKEERELDEVKMYNARMAAWAERWNKRFEDDAGRTTGKDKS